MRRRALLLLPLILGTPLVLGRPVSAQETAPEAAEKPDAKAVEKENAKRAAARKKAILKFARVQRENRMALLGYRWNQREEVWVERERRATRMLSLGFDVAGRMQATLLSHKDIKAKRRRDRMAPTTTLKKQTKALRTWVEKAEKIVHAYVYYSPAKMVAFLERAEIKQGEGAFAEAVAAYGTGFAQPGDRVRIWVDPATMHLVRIEYATQIGGDAISGWVTYGTLEDGKRYYAARSELRAPSKRIRVTLQNFNPLPPPKAKDKAPSKEDD